MKLPAALFLLPALLREALAYTALSNTTLLALPAPGDDFDIHTGQLLAPMLRPRVPGSPGSAAVLRHFVDFFLQNLPEWRLSFQNSSQTTPVSNGAKVPFVNLIATRDPPWAGGDGDTSRLTLVAHYDSKLTPENFIGATDSAAPCAMLLHAARSLDAALTSKWAAAEAAGEHEIDDPRGLQILLLDGEEAFQVWTSRDSLYGARALAEEWEVDAYAGWSQYSSPLDTIELFVLLDLLGAAGPRVPSYFKTTHWAYQRMGEVESRLRAMGRFKSSPNHASKRAAGDARQAEPRFLAEVNKKETDRWAGGYVEDDHVPFMARGVDVLHLIPTPFPNVWHTILDDGEHLDMDTVEDWALLTVAFAAEWLDVEGYWDVGGESAQQADEGKRWEKSELDLVGYLEIFTDDAPSHITIYIASIPYTLHQKTSREDAQSISAEHANNCVGKSKDEHSGNSTAEKTDRKNCRPAISQRQSPFSTDSVSAGPSAFNSPSAYRR